MNHINYFIKRILCRRLVFTIFFLFERLAECFQSNIQSLMQKINIFNNISLYQENKNLGKSLSQVHCSSSSAIFFTMKVRREH